MVMVLVNCQRENVPVQPTNQVMSKAPGRTNLATEGTMYSQILAKLFSFPEFKSLVENYYLAREANDSLFNYVVKLSELRDNYDARHGTGSFMNYLESVLSESEYTFVFNTIDGIGEAYPGIFIPYYHDSIGSADWNLTNSDEVLLNYNSGIAELRGYNYSGNEVRYTLTQEELLRKGRVIFSFVDSAGNDVGGLEVGERKFWGWDCHTPIGDCHPNNGCVDQCFLCDKYIFGIPVRVDVEVDIFQGC